jgi:hypothetical protein
MEITAAAPADIYDYLPAETDTGIRCGGCSTPWDIRRHASVADVRRCCAVMVTIAAEVNDELAAEGAWLRAAESGTPDTWREDDIERMAAASGLPVPPGMS